MNILAVWRRMPRVSRIVLTRLALIIPQMFGVMLVTFLLVRMLPGDPARLMLGNFATEDSIALYRERLGLDKPVWTQFMTYVENVFRGDLGTSPFTSNPILTDLAERAPATLELITCAMILTLIIGIGIAVVSVVRKGGVVDYGARLYGLAAGAIPDFWMALILTFVFFYLLGAAVLVETLVSWG
ncbi:MAG: ABC transporter permease, partial [Rhizobiales bacterium]|nr:ABC transporter permease [Hyphomicrobiales bacterium]